MPDPGAYGAYKKKKKSTVKQAVASSTLYARSIAYNPKVTPAPPTVSKVKVASPKTVSTHTVKAPSPEPARRSSSRPKASTPAVNPNAPIVTRFGVVPNSVASLIKKHFKPSDWVAASEISYMESGWSTTAVNDTTAKGGGELNVPYVTGGGLHALTEQSVGLFQINVGAWGGDIATWSNPEANVAKAAQLRNLTGGWGSWKVSAGRLGYYGSGQAAVDQATAAIRPTSVLSVPTYGAGSVDSHTSPHATSHSQPQVVGHALVSPTTVKPGQDKQSRQAQQDAPKGFVLAHTPVGDVTVPKPGHIFVSGVLVAVGLVLVIIGVGWMNAKAAGKAWSFLPEDVKSSVSTAAKAAVLA